MVFAWLAFISWVGLATWLSSLPARELPDMPVRFAHMDKVLHAGLFLGGSLLFSIALALTWTRVSRILLFVVSLIFLAGFGVINEWQQVDVRGRSGGDVWDASANVTGVFMGSSVLFFLRRRPKNEFRRESISPVSSDIVS